MSDTDLLSGEASDVQVDRAPSTTQPEAATAAGAPAENGSAPRRRAGLTGMVLADLRQLAGSLGITDTAGMRKGDLIAAIKQRQEGGSAPAQQPTLAGPAASAPAESATSAPSAPS
ncbi:MAG TPA: Rho termination factor N-terminal domain-containing protein, partial [Pseudonocardiaceae bacterium]